MEQKIDVFLSLFFYGKKVRQYTKVVRAEGGGNMTYNQSIHLKYIVSIHHATFNVRRNVRMAIKLDQKRGLRQ